MRMIAKTHKYIILDIKLKVLKLYLFKQANYLCYSEEHTYMVFLWVIPNFLFIIVGV